MELFLLVAGAILGGFVNGMTGFGFALMASGLWLQILAPTLVVPLVVVSMLASNLQALPRVWHMIEARRTLPLALGGVLGVPLGVWLLPQIPIDQFKLAVVVLILLNFLFISVLRNRLHLPARYENASPLAGFLGGIFAGLNGLSGVVTTIWSGLFGWSKREKRGVFQGYNLIMALTSLAFFYSRGYLNAEFFYYAVIVIPISLISAFIGVRVFERLADLQFTILINGLLLFSAFNLLLSVMMS